MASTVPDFGKIKKFNKPTKFRYVRMLVVDNLKGQTVGEKVSENIKYDSVVKLIIVEVTQKTKIMFGDIYHRL